MVSTIGIDPSLTQTGIAVRLADGTMYTNSLPTTGHRSDSLAERWQRLEAIVTWIEDEVLSAECRVAVIEHPIDIRGGSKIDRFGLFWLIVDRLMVARLTVHQVSPSARAAAPTGNGRSSKQQVTDAVSLLYPDASPRNYDEADALALLHWLEKNHGWN